MSDVQQFIRPGKLAQRLCVSKPTLWRMWAKRGILPPPIRLSPGVSAWPVEVIEQFIAERAAGSADASDGSR